jgi:CheY-like chemotaxis protein
VEHDIASADQPRLGQLEIITDVSMPVMEGWETIRRLRADERTRHIRIIVRSGDRRE